MAALALPTLTRLGPVQYWPRSTRDGAFVFRGERYEVWLHRPLPEGARIGAGSFSQDTRGRWYINCPVEVCEGVCLPGSWRWTRRVGIDLGLKDLATLSTGEKVQVPKFYRRSEERLATVQRARKTKRARAIHAKIANRRKDFLHKASAKLAKEYGFIFVGGGRAHANRFQFDASVYAGARGG